MRTITIHHNNDVYGVHRDELSRDEATTLAHTLISGVEGMSFTITHGERVEYTSNEGLTYWFIQKDTTQGDTYTTREQDTIANMKAWLKAHTDSAELDVMLYSAARRA